MTFGSPRYNFTQTDSTNDRAKELVRNGAAHGTAVRADLQTKGRGRLERSWDSEAGLNLLVSFIAYPTRTYQDICGLPLLTGLAAREVVAEAAGMPAVVKWPNDILLQDRKICGILVETGFAAERLYAVIGIGINVNQTAFPGGYRHPPTSIALARGEAYTVEAVFELLCDRLSDWYSRWEAGGTAAIVDAWRHVPNILGSRMRVSEGGRTEDVFAVDLRDDGALIVRDDDGSERAIVAGDLLPVIAHESSPPPQHN